jgi:hypothetical protein
MAGTYFYCDGERIGSAPTLLAIPLFVGMKITLEGHTGEFEVVTWDYHHGHEIDQDGLRIHFEKR